MEAAFRYAVARINDDKTLLPDTQLEYEVAYVSPSDSFRASKLGEYLTDGRRRKDTKNCLLF